MEINKITDVEGAVATEDIVEGRMVLLTTHGTSHDFGSRTDLPGIKLPDTAAESAKAFYVAGFASDNRQLPIYVSPPSYTYALRMGWDQAVNVPFSATVFLTHPQNLIGQTIPSGSLALAYGGGTFTVPSGSFVYNANLATPGTYLAACNTADDGAAYAGMLKYTASGTGAVAKVHRFDSTNFALTFRTLVP